MDERPAAEEATFADVLNGLTMGASKPRKRARVRQEPRQQAAEPAPQPVQYEDAPEENAASVRAYAWTGGRTRSSGRLEIETLVSTARKAEEMFHQLRSEHQAISRLCHDTKSVAEIGALLSLPIGIVRVLLDDMAGLGLVTVHHNQTTGEGEPDMELLNRVLRGLTNLRS
jgi:hypothetical protein